MNNAVYKILTENKVYFCEEVKNPLTSSFRMMIECFDVFIIEEGWFFYRLKEDCKNRGYLDEDECLIGPCEGYDMMICMAKLFSGDSPVAHLESLSWIEEKEFHKSRKRGTLSDLIDEMCKIDQDNEGDLISSESYDRSDDSVISASSDSEGDHKYGHEDDTGESNFAHGYSSDENSEKSKGKEEE